MAIIVNPCVQVKPERNMCTSEMLGNIERLIWKNVYKNVTGDQFITPMMWTKRLLYSTVKSFPFLTNASR